MILDARYEKVRLDGVIQSQAVFLAIGINWEGRRQLLGVELAQLFGAVVAGVRKQGGRTESLGARQTSNDGTKARSLSCGSP